MYLWKTLSTSAITIAFCFGLGLCFRLRSRRLVSTHLFFHTCSRFLLFCSGHRSISCHLFLPFFCGLSRLFKSFFGGGSFASHFTHLFFATTFYTFSFSVYIRIKTSFSHYHFSLFAQYAADIGPFFIFLE
jgi:hypothetical protein